MREAKFTATIERDNPAQSRQRPNAGGVIGGLLVLAMASVLRGVSLNPSVLEFGSVPVGLGNVMQKVTLTNRGSADLHANSIDVRGIAAADFRLDRSSCASLRPGESCALFVSFQPQEPGERQARLIVETSNGEQLNADLSGIATVAAVTVSPGGLDFGNISLRSQSPVQYVSLRGEGGFHVHDVSLSGDGNQFSFAAGKCGTEQVYVKTCRIAVWFVPQTAGDRQARLTIADDGVGGPHTVSLRGMATAVATLPPVTNPVPVPSPVLVPNPAPKPLPSPSIRVEPAVVDFMSGSRQQQVNVYNDGDAPLSLHVGLSGAEADRFEVNPGACTVAVAPGSRCGIEVKYKTKWFASKSKYSAQLDITHNAKNIAAQSVALRWQRVAPNHTPQPHIAVDPAGLDFSGFYKVAALYSAARPRPQMPVTIVNDGPVVLQQLNARVGYLDAGKDGPFSQTNNCQRLAPGEKCTMTVSFAPAQKTTYSAKLYIFEGLLTELGTVDLSATLRSPPAPPVGLVAAPPKAEPVPVIQ